MQPNVMTPLVLATGPYSGLFETWKSWDAESDPYQPGWQPPDGWAERELFAVHAEFPPAVGAGWAWTSAHGWELAVADPAGPGGWRPATDAERFQRAIDARITALKAEVETYIDDGIYPITRSMLRDGVLSDAVADDVREFIALCYAEANETIDAIEAVATIGEVDDPAPVWPIYGGAA